MARSGSEHQAALSAFSRGGWRTYTTRDGLPSNDVNTVVMGDARHALGRHGRRTGVRARTDRCSVPVHARGDPARSRSSALAPWTSRDRSGSRRSIACLRVDREPLLRCEVTERRGARVRPCRRPADGRVEVRRHRTLVTDSRGRVWLALGRGSPWPIPDARDAPGRCRRSRTWSRCSADGGPIDLRGAIAIPAGRQRLALRLYRSQPLRARARPLPLSARWLRSGWSEPTADRADGVHEPRARASTVSASWRRTATVSGTVARRAGFEIRPMLWQTRWFQRWRA